jgi:hypothetical protein
VLRTTYTSNQCVLHTLTFLAFSPASFMAATLATISSTASGNQTSKTSVGGKVHVRIASHHTTSKLWTTNKFKFCMHAALILQEASLPSARVMSSTLGMGVLWSSSAVVSMVVTCSTCCQTTLCVVSAYQHYISTTCTWTVAKVQCTAFKQQLRQQQDPFGKQAAYLEHFTGTFTVA